MVYIGLQGFIGAGKDTAGRYIHSREDFVKDSFATTLKDVCAVLFDWPRELLEGDTEDSRVWREEVDTWWSNKLDIPNFTPRHALQYIGTDVIRNHFHPDMWLLTFQRRMEKNANGRNVILTDCRFKNEINFFKQVGGKIVLVDDGTVPEWHRYALSANRGNLECMVLMEQVYSHIHRSEWDWVGTVPDLTIMNDFDKRDDATYDEFLRRIDDAILELQN